MNADAAKLFKSWQGSTAAISNPDLRQRSEQRLTTAKQRFEEIRTTGQSATALYAPFMKSLQDQVMFLGHDLNPGAVGALKPDAEKLNAQAQELSRLVVRTWSPLNDRPARPSPDEVLVARRQIDIRLAFQRHTGRAIHDEVVEQHVRRAGRQCGVASRKGAERPSA